MDKKSDSLRLLASPAASSPGAPGEDVPYVSGAVLQQAGLSTPELSPAAAEPLPVILPPVDKYRDEPDEIDRLERIGGLKKRASPAAAGHADPHFKLDSLVDAHLAEGYVGSTDLKTRVDVEHEYASDTCVRRAGIDPTTGTRYLEELVFEVVHKRPKQETDTRAEGFAARGVPRQIGVFVRKKVVCEWVKSENNWGESLDLRQSLRAPCLAVPLPLAALLDPELARKAIARALEAKGDPSILEMKKKSEKRGRSQGKAEGLAEAVLILLRSRGFVLSEEEDERIRATTDVERLRRWLRRTASAASKGEVFDESS